MTVSNRIFLVTVPIRIRQRPSSWSSTPDLEEAQKAKTSFTPQSVKKPDSDEVSISVQLPVRRKPVVQTTFENVSTMHIILTKIF